jgi:hypothetical protein
MGVGVKMILKKISTKIGICFVAFIFFILISEHLFTFINIGILGLYWLAVPLLISLSAVLKFKIARWLMLIGFWLLFFYELIGTNMGMTICFSSNIWVFIYPWSFADFIYVLPHLLYIFIIYGFSIFILSNNKSYKFFELDRSIRIHELVSFGLIAFSIIYFDMIYYWFLS